MFFQRIIFTNYNCLSRKTKWFFFYIQASAIGNVHKIKSKELQNILRIKGIKRGNGIETQGNDEHSSKFLEHRVVMEMLQTDTNVWGMLKGLKNVKNKIKLPHFLVYCSSQEPPLLWSSPGLCCHLWNLTSERRERCCHTRSSRIDKANNGKWLHPLKEVHPLTDSWMVLKDKNRQPLIHWYKVTSSMLSLSLLMVTTFGGKHCNLVNDIIIGLKRLITGEICLLKSFEKNDSSQSFV